MKYFYYFWLYKKLGCFKCLLKINFKVSFIFLISEKFLVGSPCLLFLAAIHGLISFFGTILIYRPYRSYFLKYFYRVLPIEKPPPSFKSNFNNEVSVYFVYNFTLQKVETTWTNMKWNFKSSRVIVYGGNDPGFLDKYYYLAIFERGNLCRWGKLPWKIISPHMMQTPGEAYCRTSITEINFIQEFVVLWTQVLALKLYLKTRFFQKYVSTTRAVDHKMISRVILVKSAFSWMAPISNIKYFCFRINRLLNRWHPLL